MSSKARDLTKKQFSISGQFLNRQRLAVNLSEVYKFYFFYIFIYPKCQRSPKEYIFISSSVHFFYAWFTLFYGEKQISFRFTDNDQELKINSLLDFKNPLVV